MYYREAVETDIESIANIRAIEWGNKEYWIRRIHGYMRSELHPQHALIPRIVYVSTDDNLIAGFIAGHLTQRYQCDGELQWINVLPEYRRGGAATGLLRILAKWFIEQNAFRICVDVDPENLVARKFYMKYGAAELNEHWLFWSDIKDILVM